MQENQTGRGGSREGLGPAHAVADGRAAAPRTVSDAQCPAPGFHPAGREGEKGLQKAQDHQPSINAQHKLCCPLWEREVSLASSDTPPAITPISERDGNAITKNKNKNSLCHSKGCYLIRPITLFSSYSCSTAKAADPVCGCPASSEPRARTAVLPQQGWLGQVAAEREGTPGHSKMGEPLPQPVLPQAWHPSVGMAEPEAGSLLARQAQTITRD